MASSSYQVRAPSFIFSQEEWVVLCKETGVNGFFGVSFSADFPIIKPLLHKDLNGFKSHLIISVKHWFFGLALVRVLIILDKITYEFLNSLSQIAFRARVNRPLQKSINGPGHWKCFCACFIKSNRCLNAKRKTGHGC